MDSSDQKESSLVIFDPWALLAGMPHITVKITRLRDDEMGRYVHSRQTILLDDRLTQAERRCTLVHEMVHHFSGDHHDDPNSPTAEAQERHCRDRAARLLIPLPKLVEAMLWSEHQDEIAEYLWVDEATLWDRIDNLTAAEGHRIHDEIAATREDVA